MLEAFLGKSRYANHGQRVVEGQRLMQSASDIMLGWIRTNGIDGVTRDFYIRQLWDGKGSAVVEAMNPAALSAYAGLCGWTLARAHARSGEPPQSQATSAPVTVSTKPCRGLQKPTPTRTSATTPRSNLPSTPGSRSRERVRIAGPAAMPDPHKQGGY